LNFSIGNICFAVDEALAGQQPHVLSFCTGNTPEAECAPVDSPLRPGRCVFDSGLTWRLHEMDDAYAICMYRGPARAVYQTLGLSRDFLTARLAPVHKNDLTTDPGFSLDGPLFQLWVNFLLMQSRGVVLHALGVKVDGEAHLFCGPSGVGKTTLGRLFADAGVGTILSDDRIIVRREGQMYFAYGTPWNGESAFHSAENAPVRSVHFLRQFSSCDIRKISRADAATRLFALSSVAGWPMDSGINFVLDFTAHLAGAASCDLFGFTPDFRALDALGWR
jgi:hypothetical protein